MWNGSVAGLLSLSPFHCGFSCPPKWITIIKFYYRIAEKKNYDLSKVDYAINWQISARNSSQFNYLRINVVNHGSSLRPIVCRNELNVSFACERDHCPALDFSLAPNHWTNHSNNSIVISIFIGEQRHTPNNIHNITLFAHHPCDEIIVHRVNIYWNIIIVNNILHTTPFVRWRRLNNFH